MKVLIKLTLKNAIHDPYLLFWSLLIPIGVTISFGYFIEITDYPLRILTGMLCTSVIFYAYMTTVFTNVAQRRRGVYKLLRITPLSLWKYILSLSLAWTIIAILLSYVVLFVGMLVFNIQISIFELLSMLPIIILATLGYIFLSFFISSFCKNEGHASIINNLISMPMMFCSDAFYSLQTAPKMIVYISKINPFQFFVTGIRSAISNNIQLYMISSVALVIMLLIALVLAIKTFKYSD